MIQHALAIPNKRHDKREVDFLVQSEIQVILAAPNLATWLGRRDYTLLLLAAHTGLRLSEMTSLDGEPSTSTPARVYDALERVERSAAHR